MQFKLEDFQSQDAELQQALKLSMLDLDASPNHNEANQSTGQFSRRYKAYTFSNDNDEDDDNKMSEKYKRLEISRNIILPESTMQELAAYQCQFPYILKVSNKEFTTHCGVEEFSAPSQSAILPPSIYKQLNLSPHSEVLCEYVTLQPATKLVFETNKISIKDQKGYMAAIRNKIGKLTSLSLLDTIQVQVNDETYQLTLAQATPNIYEAVSLLNVQWSVDIEIENKKDPINIQPKQEINQNQNESENENDNENDPEMAAVHELLDLISENDDNNPPKSKKKEEQQQNECPIVSSISSTKGGSNNNNNDQQIHRTKGALQQPPKPNRAPVKATPRAQDDDINLEESDDSEDGDDESASLLIDDNNNNTNDGTAGGGLDIDLGEDIDNDSNAGFTSEENGWGTAADEEHSDWDYDGQDYIPIKPKEYTPAPNQGRINEDDEELIPDKDTTAGGINDSSMRPSRIKQVEHRAWICEHCYAINNLIASMARNYQCACCAGRYRPGQKLIESSEQDAPIQQKERFTVWACVCSWINDISWTNCSACGTKKPDEGLATWITEEKPNMTGAGLLNQNNQQNGQNGDGVANANDGLLRKQLNGNRNHDNVGQYQYQWHCPKCFTQNAASNTYCENCRKYRNRNEHAAIGVNQSSFNNNNKSYNNLNGKRRIQRYGDLYKMGKSRGRHTYPIFGDVNIKMNQRLIKIFGKSYRNELIARIPGSIQKNVSPNAWGPESNNKVSNGLMRVDKWTEFKIRPLGPRAVAINEKTGYLAVLTANDIFILRPGGSCGFIIDTIFRLPATHQVTSSWMALELCRIRFVENSIYIFHYDKHTIQYYDYDAKNQQITYVSEIFDKYFVEAKITDIVVTKNLLIVLFDRWLGVYKLYPELAWYHAVAFSKTDNVSVRSIEMSCYDDWEDRLPISKEVYFIHSQESVNKLLEAREDEEKQAMEDEMKEVVANANEKDGVVPLKAINKKSIKNWIFINCENHIIAVHPTNPTFDFITIADNVLNGSSYCNSRKYGTFYVNNNKDRIMQSSKYSGSQCNIVCQVGHVIPSEEEFKWDKHKFRMIPLMNDDTDNGMKSLCHKDIEGFNSVLYDENWGISGRLLAQCVLKEDKDKDLSGSDMFYQLFNQTELKLLKQELERNDYFLMPGTDTKPFNLIVYVFEMLYGSDLIDHLLQAPDFNPVYALPGKEEEEDVLLPGQEEEKKEEPEEVELQNLSPNKLLIVGSACLVYVEDKWCNGKVIKEIKENDKEDILEIEYEHYKKFLLNLEHYETGKVKMERFSDKLKYNEAIPISADIKYKEVWNVGDRCLYFAGNLNTWFPGEVKAIFKDEEGKWIRIDYREDELPVSIKLSMDDEDALCLNLRKLEDVVSNNKDKDKNENDDENKDDSDKQAEIDMELEYEQIDGPNAEEMAMMNIMGEGPMDQSYIAIKPVGAENEENIPEGPNDDGLGAEADVDVDDMEIEAEGVNDNDNNQ